MRSNLTATPLAAVQRALRLALALLLLGLFTFAAEREARAEGCVPGQQVQCPCLKDRRGVQTCNADGLSFGPCDCPRDRAAEEKRLATTAPDAPKSPKMVRGGIAMVVIGGAATTVVSIFLGLIEVGERDHMLKYGSWLIPLEILSIGTLAGGAAMIGVGIQPRGASAEPAVANPFVAPPPAGLVFRHEF